MNRARRGVLLNGAEQNGTRMTTSDPLDAEPPVSTGGPAPPPTAEEETAFVASLRAVRAQSLAEDDLPVSAGGPPRPLPTPEEIAEFEAAMREVNARFLAAALAEDGMPISAGWRGPLAHPDATTLDGGAPDEKRDV